MLDISEERNENCIKSLHATITEYHRLGRLNNSNLFFKSKIEMFKVDFICSHFLVFIGFPSCTYMDYYSIYMYIQYIYIQCIYIEMSI